MPDADLAFDIAHALRETPVTDGCSTPTERDEAVAGAAGKVIAHLKRCGWEFTRRPPGPAHSTHDNKPG